MLALLQAAHDAAPAGKDMLTPVVTGLVVGLGTVVTQVINHRRGKKKDASGSSVLTRIETKIDNNHAEMRQTCQNLGVQIAEARSLATDALHFCVGPDGENGLRSQVNALEKWQESESIRERDRLQRIADGLEERRDGPTDRRLGPTDVGVLNPRPA